ncbi:MAG: hypothetical protein KME06_16120 [Kastovskya adunca ATA6-11-RM4]|jgi:hypothetical protein|nr:hypothetical protein [Kastovskya adunca ATA6-11-RM4]
MMTGTEFLGSQAIAPATSPNDAAFSGYPLPGFKRYQIFNNLACFDESYPI